MNYRYEYESPYGILDVESDGESITAIRRRGLHYSAKPMDTEAIITVLERAKEWLDIYFSGHEPSFTPPLAPEGNSFRQAVWEILSTTPYGELITYGDIAKMIAKQHGISRMSAQAVGGAVGNNPISIIIPCHRVVGANGNLTGYRGGLDAKIELLTIEGVDMSRLYIPKKNSSATLI